MTKKLSSEIKTYGLLGLLMTGMVVFSMLFLVHQSLRLDESQSLWQTSNSIPRIFNIVAQDVHVPLYHLLLHIWEIIWGNGVVASRILSLIFALATIPAAYTLGREAFTKRIGIFFAALMTISPFMNWYANEIRMYSLLTFITVMSHIFFLRSFRSNTKNSWILYGVTASLGIFIHYFFVLNLLSQALFFFFNRSKFPEQAFDKLRTIATIVIVLFIPWVTYVFHLGLANHSQPRILAPTASNVFDTFSQFVFGFQNDQINSLILSLWPLLVLFGFLILHHKQKIPTQINYFLIAAFFPIVAAFLVSITITPLFLSRYLIISMPAVYLLVVWLIDKYPAPLSTLIKSVLIGFMLFALIQQAVSAQTPVKENFDQASAYIANQASPRDIVFISPPFTIYPIEYYYHGSTTITTIPDWNQYAIGAIPDFDETKFEQQVTAYKATHQKAWVLLSYDQGYQEKVRLYFDTHFQRDLVKNFSPGLNLYVYELQ